MIINATKYIEHQGITFRQETFEFKGKTFTFNILKKHGRRANKVIFLHDSEDQAFDTGIKAIGEHGGRLIALENAEKEISPESISIRTEFFPKPTNIIRWLKKSSDWLRGRARL